MKLHKFQNKHLGEYHTYDVNDVYEAIYAAKYPSVVLKMKDNEDLSDNKQAVAKMQLFKVQEHKNNFMEMLLKNKVQIIEPNTTIVPGFSYIKYQNNKWKPIFLSSKQEGGLDIITCENFLAKCKEFLNTDKCLFTDNVAKDADALKCCEFDNKTCHVKIEQQFTIDKPESNLSINEIQAALLTIVNNIELNNTNLVKAFNEKSSKIDTSPKEEQTIDNDFTKLIQNIREKKQSATTPPNKTNYYAKQVKDKYFFIKKHFLQKNIQSKPEKTKTKLLNKLTTTLSNKLTTTSKIQLDVENFKKLVIATAIQVRKHGWKYIHDSMPSYQFLNLLYELKTTTKAANGDAGNDAAAEGAEGAKAAEGGADAATEAEEETHHTLEGFFPNFYADNDYELDELSDEDWNFPSDSDSDDESENWNYLTENHSYQLGDVSDEENIYNELLDELDEEKAGLKETNVAVNPTQTKNAKTNQILYKFLKYISFFVFIILLFRQISLFPKMNTLSNVSKRPDRKVSTDEAVLRIDNNPYYTNKQYVIPNLNYGSGSTSRKVMYDEQDINKIMYSVRVEQIDTKCSNIINIQKIADSLNNPQVDISPECKLIHASDKTLSFSQQLLAHRDNLIVHFVNMVHHMFIMTDSTFQPETENMKLFKDIIQYDQLKDVKATLFDKPGATMLNYEKLIKKDNIPSLLANFQAFTSTYNTVPKVRGFFRDYFELMDTNVHQSFIDRMNYFENVLVQHIKNYENGIEFKNHTCTMKSYANEITATFPISTTIQVGEMTDLKTENVKKAIEKIKIFLIPQVEAILRMYYDLYVAEKESKKTITVEDLNKMKIGYDYIHNKVKYNTYVIDFSPQFKTINTKLEELIINENKENSVENHLIYFNTNLLTPLQNVNDHWKAMIEKFKSNIALGKYVNNINFLLGNQVSQAELVTQEMFHRFQMFALDEAKSTYTNFLPNYFYTLNDVSSMIVKKINDHVYTSSDEMTVKYVIANQVSSLIYEMFSDPLDDVIHEITDIPVIKQAWNIGTAVLNIYSGEQYDNYLAISKSAMRSLATERNNIQNRINRGFSGTNDVIKTTYQTLVSTAKNILSRNQQSVPVNILKNVAQNFSNDYIRLQLEVEKIELALILLHLQNDILSKDTDKKPVYDTTINLNDDDNFLLIYHSEKHIYLQKIMLKNWLIMGLLKIERDGYTNNWELPTFNKISTPTSAGGGNITTDEEQLIDSFISNAKVHNKMVLGNINDFGDINDKLKKKLIKSFVKHNKSNSKTIKKIKNFERKYNMRNRGDDFLGI